MYIPRYFELEDHEAIAGVLRDHSFGTLVTAFDGEAQATHLPFSFDPDRGQNGTLVSHMARANPQWQQFARYGPEGGMALAIFQGPHSYISPTWYGDTEPAVPTWNYVAVHAYGRPVILDDPSAVRALLDQLVDKNEASLDPAWALSRLSDDYVERMMRAIVAFEMPLERLEAKAKLSQNKSAEMRLSAADALESQGWPDSAELARLMRDPR